MTAHDALQDGGTAAAPRRHALLLAPALARSALAALYALRDDVLEAADIADPGAAGAKLAWWRDELGRLAAGTAQHPAARVLMQPPWRERLASAALAALLVGAERMSLQSRQLDFAGLERQCRATDGQVARLAAALLDASPAGQDAAEELGTAGALVQGLRDLGRHARHGRIDLPVDELQAHGVTAAELQRRAPPWGYGERFSRLMAFQCSRAAGRLTQALARVPRADRRRLRPLVFLARADLAWLDALPALDYQVLHQQVLLNPLRSAWLALRTRLGA